MPKPFAFLIAVLLLIPQSLPAESGESNGIWINPALGIATPGEAADRLRRPFIDWLHLHQPVPAGLAPDEAFFAFRQGPGFSYSGKLFTCIDILGAFDNGMFTTYAGEGMGSKLDWSEGSRVVEYCLGYRNLALLDPIPEADMAMPDFRADKLTLLRLAPTALLIDQSEMCRAAHFESRGRPERVAYWPWGRTSAIDRRTTIAVGSPWREGQAAEWALWGEGEPRSFKGLTFVPRLYFEKAHNLYFIEIWGIGRRRAIPGAALVALVGGSLPWGLDRRPPEIAEIYFEPHVAVLTHDPRRDLFRFRNFDDYYPAMLDNGFVIHHCYGWL